MTNPDQNIPAGLTQEDAKKAREWALHALNRPGASNTAEKAVARVVIGTVPEQRPTLADMTPEKREECRWMHADTEKWGRVVIVDPCWKDGNACVAGVTVPVPWKSVTPRPDLPRLEWSGDKKPAPDLPGGWRIADHKDNGRVIVTTPNDDGRVYYVFPSDLDGLGFDWLFCHTDELTYLDGDQ